jgi:nitroreductase
LDAATGDFIAFVDSDDELYPNAVEALIRDVSDYGADVVSALKHAVDKDGNAHCSHEDGEITVYRGEEPLLLSLEGDRNTNSACAKLFKADFIRAIEEHRDGDKLLPRWLAAPAIQLRNGKGDVFFRNAAGMLIVSCDERRPGVTTPHEDVVIACSQFELLAQSLGLGTCWCGFLSLVQREVPELLEKTLGIRRTTPFYAMLFGIPAVRYQRTVQRDDEAEIEWKE